MNALNMSAPATAGALPVAVYLRFSQDREGDALGCERHEAECRKLADRLGIAQDRLVIYADNDTGASTRSRKPRPAYARMMREVQSGRLGTVLCYSMSRLTRRPAEGEEILALAESEALKVHTVASGDPDMTRVDGRMIYRFLVAADCAEAERIGERVALQKAQRAAMGGNLGGPRAFGYSANGAELVPEEADAIRWAVSAVIAGESMRAIAKEWEARGLRGRTGKPLPTPTIRDIILRPRIAGLTEYKGAIVGVSALPAIVSEDDWRSASAVLRDPSRKQNLPGRPARGMLSGALKCGRCGAPCYTRNRHNVPRYACHRADCVQQGRDRLDEIATEYVLTYVEANRDALRAPEPSVTASAADEVAAIKRDLKTWEQLSDAGDISPADYVARTRPLRARLADAEARALEESACPVTASLAAATDLPAAWAAMSLDAQRTVIRRLFASLTLLPAESRGVRCGPERLRVEWSAAVRVPEEEGADIPA